MSNESRMALDNLESRVLKVLAEQITGSPENTHLIKPESHLYQDLRFDSLELREAAMALESEFGIKLPDEEVAKITTVQQIIDLIAGVCMSQELVS